MDNKHNSLNLAAKYARIFVLGLYLFRFSEQIMSADKYPSIFSRQMKAIIYVIAFLAAELFKVFIYASYMTCVVRAWTQNDVN